MPLPGERQTGANFLSDWLRECAKPRVRPKTYDNYSWIVNHHLTPGLGRVRLARLNPQQIQTFLNGRRQSDLSPRTIQHIHAVLRIALSQTQKWSLVTRNAAALVDTPKVRRPEIQPMTPSEVQLFLDAIGGDRPEALFILAVAVGLRQGEALGLLWDDAVDLDQGTLTVRYALQRVDKKLTLVEPKTLKSRRTLHLPQFLKAALLRHRAVQEEERLLAGSRWLAGDRVRFYNQDRHTSRRQQRNKTLSKTPTEKRHETDVVVMISGMFAPPCCCSKECIHAWLWKRWATARSALR